MKNKNMKYRPCNCRSISFSISSFMLFFLVTFGILPSIEEKNIALLLIVIFFLLHILFVFYSLLKMNSYISIEDEKVLQKQFGKTIDIRYNDITDVKLSFAFYVRASYAVKIYSNNKRIMFEISSKVFDAFMNNCSNTEIKNRITSLLKEKEIY